MLAIIGRCRKKHTVHCRLLRMGLHSCRPVRVLMLTPVHHQECLQWAWNSRTGPWNNGRRWPGLMNHVFFYNMWLAKCVCVMAAGCTVGRRQAGGGSVMLWAIFCWETLGPGIHVDVTWTRTTYLNIVADHVHPVMARVFPDGRGLSQQGNALCHTAQSCSGMV